jgi:hypothetical protein
MKKNLMILFSILLIGGAVIGAVLDGRSRSVAKAETVENHTVPIPAPPGSIDPSPQWLATYDQLDALNVDLQARKVGAVQKYVLQIESERDPVQRALDEFQLEADLIAGIDKRLGSQINAGTVWNASVRKFVPSVPQVPATK